MGKALCIACTSWWAFASFIFWAATVAAFIVYLTLSQFYQVACIVWGVTGGFLIAGIFLLASAWIMGVCMVGNGEDETEKNYICGITSTVYFLIFFACCLGMSMVCIAVVFELPNGSNSNLEVIYLGSYSNSIQKVFIRDPLAISIQAQYSFDNSTWLSGIPNPGIPSATTDYVTVFSLPLLPSTSYYIRAIKMYNDSSNTTTAPFLYNTPAGAGDPRNVTFSHGSCQFPFYKRGLPRWNDIATLKPEFFLFIGDFIYADVVRPVQPTDIEWFQVLYRHIFTLSEIKGNFIKWPSYFMFDDHELFNDYVNGTNSNMEIYGQAIDGAWRNYLGQGNPSPNAPYYYNFNIGVGAFFVLDTRSFRSAPQNPDNTSTMIGIPQRNALLNWLSSETAVFKFIVSTSPWSQNIGQKDSWNGYANERELIMNYIKTNNITGVTILTGDDHTLGVYEVGNGIFEFSVSPIDGFGAPFSSINRIDKTLCYIPGASNRHAGTFTYSMDGPYPSLSFSGFTSSSGYVSPSCGPYRFELRNGTFLLV